MNKELSKWTEKIYMKAYRKYIKSRTWFIILSVLSILLVAIMIMLNIYAIKKNPFGDDSKLYYVIIAIIAGLIGLLTSISSFMSFKKNGVKYKTQYELIKDEKKAYKSKSGKYKAKERDEIFIEEIYKITNSEE